MKKITNFCIVLICFTMNAISQVPIFAGFTVGGGYYSSGTLFRYTAGRSVLAGWKNLPYDSVPGVPVLGHASPSGLLMEASNGNLYGMTFGDGIFAVGTLFEYNYPTNVYRVMVNFGGSGIAGNAEGSLMQANNGLVYGFTDFPYLFSYRPGDTHIDTLTHIPQGRLNGHAVGISGAMIQAHNGLLYGMYPYIDTTLHFAGKSIFEYNINTNVCQIRHLINGSNIPYASLLEAGIDTLYGLTGYDNNAGSGTLFRYTISDSSFTTLYSFTIGSGVYPGSTLTRGKDGKLYGSLSGGGSFGYGTLFSYDIYNNQFLKIHDFDGVHGSYSHTTLYPASDGRLYGVTKLGGINDQGTLFQYDIDSARFSYILSMDSTSGKWPIQGLTEFRPVPPCHADSAFFSVSICAGSAYHGHTTAGIYSLDRLINRGGCDSFRIVTLSLIPPPAPTVISATICHGLSYTGHQISGTFTDTLSGIRGCDSIRIVHLTVTPSPPPTSSAIHFCTGVSYHGHRLSGTYSDTLSSISGCDSISIIHLSFTSNPATIINAQFCDGDNYHGHTAPGIFSDTLIGIGGCDSMVSLVLTFYPHTPAPVITRHGDSLIATAAAGYLWLLNNNPVSGAFNQVLQITANGIYTLMVTDTNSCSAFSQPMTVAYLAADNVSERTRIHLYPNPAGESFTLSVNAEMIGTPYTFTDMTGRITHSHLIKKENTIILLDGLSSGIYILQIEGRSYKVVKE